MKITPAYLLAMAGTAVLGTLLLDRAGLPGWLVAPGLMAVTLFGYRLTINKETQSEVPVSAKGREREMPAASPDQVGIAALADPAVIVSGTWRVLATNDLACDLLGQRVRGSDLRQAVRHPLVLESVRRALGGESPVVREVASLGHAEGAFRVRVVALGGSRFLVTFTDVTQARLSERMRADFVANASHELRTPLANISGFIETLLGPAAEDEPARRRFLDIMAREAGRMSRLIDDLLSLSRIELDKYVRPQTPLDLAPLLQDVGKTLAMRLEADGRRLLIEAPDELPQVFGDRDQVLQVLHNLVSNALKYGHSGTPIRLSASLASGGGRAEDMVRVSIEDQGDGIAPEHLPRLTERFYRVDAGRSRSMGGTGLGLAIVKHIVERHRGKLEIVSRQGEGSTVSFTLPVVPPARPVVVAAEEDVAEDGTEAGDRHKSETSV